MHHKNLHLIHHPSSSSTRRPRAKPIRGLLRCYRSGTPLEQGRNLFHRMSGWGNSIGINVSPLPNDHVFLIIMYFQFSLNVRGVTMMRLQASVFVASFALYFYFLLGSSFFGTQ